jgi:anti-sigma factor ChrR (cupin superfamily)
MKGSHADESTESIGFFAGPALAIEVHLKMCSRSGQWRKRLTTENGTLTIFQKQGAI